MTASVQVSALAAHPQRPPSPARARWTTSRPSGTPAPATPTRAMLPALGLISMVSGLLVAAAYEFTAPIIAGRSGSPPRRPCCTSSPGPSPSVTSSSGPTGA